MVTIDDSSLSTEVILKHIDSLVDKISQSEKAAEAAINKPVVLFVGNTGSGKSTLVNYLEGCEMYEAIGELGSTVQAKNPIARIGDEFSSETFGVHAYPGRSFTYCDCPGFLESRGTGYDIANALSIQNVATNSLAVLGIVVVLNYNSLITDKGAGLRQTAENLRLMLKNNIDEHLNSILLIITRAPANRTVEMIKSNIKKFNNPLINALLDKAILYDPLTQESNIYDSREAILQKISCLSPVDNPTSIFHYSLSSDSILAIDKLKQGILDIIQTNLASNDFSEVARMVTVLSTVNKLKLAEQEYLVALNLIQGRINSLKEQAISYIEAEQYIQLKSIFAVFQEATRLMYSKFVLTMQAELIQMIANAIDTVALRFRCPITNQLLESPVVASDGYTYSKRNIEQVLVKSRVSPITKAALSNQLIPNCDLNQQLISYVEQKILACLYFSAYSREMQLYNLSETLIDKGLNLTQSLPQANSYVIELLKAWILLRAYVPRHETLLQTKMVQLITLLCLENRYEEVVDYYREIIDLAAFLPSLGIRHLEQIAHHLKMQHHAVASAELFVYLAKQYAQEENLSQVERCYQEAIALNPAETSSYLGLASLREQEGNATDAAQIILDQLLERYIQPANMLGAKELSSELLKLFERSHKTVKMQPCHVADHDFKKLGKALFEALRYLYPQPTEVCKLIEYKKNEARGFEIRLKLANVEQERILKNLAEGLDSQLKKMDRISIDWQRASKSLFVLLKIPYLIQDRDKLTLAIKQAVPEHHKQELLHHVQSIPSLINEVNTLKIERQKTIDEAQNRFTKTREVLRNHEYQYQFFNHLESKEKNDKLYIPQLLLATSTEIAAVHQSLVLERSLIKACEENNLQQVQALHQQGALLESKPIYAPRYLNQYPLEIACENFAIEVIDYIHQALQQPELPWRAVRQNKSVMQRWRTIERGKLYLQKIQFTSNTTHEELAQVNSYLDSVFKSDKREKLGYYRTAHQWRSNIAGDPKSDFRSVCKANIYDRYYFDTKDVVEMESFTKQAIQDFHPIADRILHFLQIMNHYAQDIELEEALLKACAEGNLEQVKVLHRQGALLESKPIYDQQYQQKYPLELACENFAIEVIDYIHQVLQQPEISWRAVRKNCRIRECWRRIEEGKTYLQKFQFTSHTTHEQLSKVNKYLDIIPNFATKREELPYYRTTAPNNFYVDSKDSICNYKEGQGYSSNTVKFSKQAILEMQNFTNQAIQDFCRLADHISRLTRIMNSVIQNAESGPKGQEIMKRAPAF